MMFCLRLIFCGPCGPCGTASANDWRPSAALHAKDLVLFIEIFVFDQFFAGFGQFEFL